MNKYSSQITQPRSQGASQAMLYGVGLTHGRHAEGPGRHLQHVVRGQPVQHAPRSPGGRREGRRRMPRAWSGCASTPSASATGSRWAPTGMSYSLPSRDLIADSIETVMGAQWYDALVTVPGCDKNMPGSVMAMARLNRPSLMVYGGTIRAGPRAGAGRATSSRRSSPTASSWPAPSPTSSGSTSSSTPAPAPARAAACTPPTRWPWPSRRWACRCRTARRTPAEDPAKADECRRAPARGARCCSSSISSRATS